jgi:hypothetical protein
MRHSHTLPSEFNKFGEADRVVSDDVRNASSSLTGSGTALLAAPMRGTAQGWVLGSVKVDGFGTPSVRDNSGALASPAHLPIPLEQSDGSERSGRHRGVLDWRPLFSRGCVASRRRVERLRWIYLEGLAA